MKILLKGRLPDKDVRKQNVKYVGQCRNCGTFVKFTYAESGETVLGQVLHRCPTQGCDYSILGHRGYMAFLFSIGD